MIQLIIDPEGERLDGGTFTDGQVDNITYETERLMERMIPYEIVWHPDTDRPITTQLRKEEN